MALQGKIPKPPALPDSCESLDAALGDLRFRALLPDGDWERLPRATRQRFSKRLAGGNTAIYVGEVVDIRLSRIGWWVAQMARLIGGPLPTGVDTGVPSIVTVTEDAASGGQIWTRICARSRSDRPSRLAVWIPVVRRRGMHIPRKRRNCDYIWIRKLKLLWNLFSHY